MTENRMGTEPIGHLLLTMSVPMVLASLASSLYNVVDSMFVGMLGETALTAIATVISQCIAGAVGLVLNARLNPEVHVTRSSFAPDAGIMGKTFSIGLPNMITYSFTSIIIFAMNQVLLMFSAAAPAVYVIFVRVNNLVRLPVFGVRNTLVPIVAYNRGAGNPDRVRRTIRLSIIWGTIVMVIGAALFELFPAQMLSAFSASSEMLAIGVPAFQIVGISILVSGITVVLGGVFQAVGESWKAMVVAIVQTVSLMGSAIFFGQMGDLNLVWCAFILSEVVIAVLSLGLYLPIRKRLMAVEA